MTEKPSYLRLSAPAIARLLDAPDDEGVAFRLTLQRAVVAEVVRNMLTKDLSNELRRLVQEQVAAARNEIIAAGAEGLALTKMTSNAVSSAIASVRSSYYPPKPTEQQIDDIGRAVKTSIEHVVIDLLQEKTGLITKAMDDRAQSVLERIEGKLSGLIEAAVNAGVEERIEAGVQARLDAIRKAI